MTLPVPLDLMNTGLKGGGRKYDDWVPNTTTPVKKGSMVLGLSPRPKTLNNFTARKSKRCL